jgi:hypothetical protein
MKWEKTNDWTDYPSYMLLGDNGSPLYWGVQRCTKDMVNNWVKAYPMLKGKLRQGWYIAPPGFDWPEDGLGTILYCNMAKRYARTLKAAQVMVIMLISAGEKA